MDRYKPMKKYQDVWDKINSLYERSPGKSKDKYYGRILNNTRSWAEKCDISRDLLIDMVLEALGEKCPYCDREMTCKNSTDKVSLDHIYPTYRGGGDDIDNLQIICARCNRRKGYLTDREYRSLLHFLYSNFEDEAVRYILSQLSMWSGF